MEILKKRINIYLYKIIGVAVTLAILILLMLFSSSSSSDSKSLMGGLVTGLFVALLQLWLMSTEHNEIEKIKKLGVKNILRYREDTVIYKKVIGDATSQIWVLGNTAIRFMRDFADENVADKRVLIDALERKVHLKILLPDLEHLWSKEDRKFASISIGRIRKLKKRYNSLIECKLYSHRPFHSLVLADNEIFVGPIFPNRKSKDTPTIYTDKNSVFASSYIEYFEYEWKSAKSCR